MHLTRQEISKKVPIPRKGTKYIVRTISHIHKGVPVLIALRDMLKIAKTAKEAKAILPQIKINGRTVSDIRETIKLFNLLEADKVYRLSILPTNKFFFEEVKEKDTRLVKVINKKLVKGGNIQISLHDGTNIISKEKSIKVGDSLYLDANNKIKKHLPLEKGKKVFLIGGKFIGKTAVVQEVKGKVLVLSSSSQTITTREENAIVI